MGEGDLRKSWKQDSPLLLKHRFNSSLIAIDTASNGSPQTSRRVNKQHICLGQRSEGEAWEGLCGVSVARAPMETGKQPPFIPEPLSQHNGQQHCRGESLQSAGP